MNCFWKKYRAVDTQKIDFGTLNVFQVWRVLLRIWHWKGQNLEKLSEACKRAT